MIKIKNYKLTPIEGYEHKITLQEGQTRFDDIVAYLKDAPIPNGGTYADLIVMQDMIEKFQKEQVNESAIVQLTDEEYSKLLDFLHSIRFASFNPYFVSLIQYLVNAKNKK